MRDSAGDETVGKASMRGEQRAIDDFINYAERIILTRFACINSTTVFETSLVSEHEDVVLAYSCITCRSPQEGWFKDSKGRGGPASCRWNSSNTAWDREWTGLTLIVPDRRTFIDVLIY